MTKNISKLLTLLLVTVVVMIGLVTYLFMPNHNPFHLDDELLPKYQVLLFDLAMANSTVPPKGEEAYKVWQRYQLIRGDFVASVFHLKKVMKEHAKAKAFLPLIQDALAKKITSEFNPHLFKNNWNEVIKKESAQMIFSHTWMGPEILGGEKNKYYYARLTQAFNEKNEVKSQTLALRSYDKSNHSLMAANDVRQNHAFAVAIGYPLNLQTVLWVYQLHRDSERSHMKLVFETWNESEIQELSLEYYWDKREGRVRNPFWGQSQHTNLTTN